MTRSERARQGRQPSVSCRSAGNGPLPLVADLARNSTILGIRSTRRPVTMDHPPDGKSAEEILRRGSTP